MKPSQLPYAIGLAIALVTIGLAGSDLAVNNALAGEVIMHEGARPEIEIPGELISSV